MLRHLSPSRRNVHRIKRLCGGDKQAVATRPAKCEICDRLRNLDLADESAVGREAMHAIAALDQTFPLTSNADTVWNAVIDVAEDARRLSASAIHDIEERGYGGRGIVVARADVGDVELVSSGEKARPFGCMKSLTTTAISPVAGSSR